MDLKYLTKRTGNVFEKLVDDKFLNDFTLVDGTALSMQIKHRLSEDLYFNYDGGLLETQSIIDFIEEEFKIDQTLIMRDNEHRLDFLIEDVKVTFFTAGSVKVSSKIKDNSMKYKQMNIATPEIIAVMKINSIIQINTITDLYDLYYIAKNVTPLKVIFDNCKSHIPKVSDITYSESIIFVDDIKEQAIPVYLKPAEKISKYKIAEYFIAEIKNYYNLKN
ncbi:MAG: nucleotidyl transferase AbiEii/AbiGii toxin family protein [Ignavibacteria bacterium]